MDRRIELAREHEIPTRGQLLSFTAAALDLAEAAETALKALRYESDFVDAASIQRTASYRLNATLNAFLATLPEE